MYYATGMPGWMRAGFGCPAFGRGNPFGFCRWFPWMPRWWWSGIYGPVSWTPQEPVLASQTATQPSVQTPVTPIQFQPQMTKEQEIQFLEQEIKALEEDKKALEEDKKALEEEIESIKKRLEELKKLIGGE
ncbi:MAG: hypothetical protein ACP5JY_00240 [Candidatus Nanoarchaeia archaeon]